MDTIDPWPAPQGLTSCPSTSPHSNHFAYLNICSGCLTACHSLPRAQGWHQPPWACPGFRTACVPQQVRKNNHTLIMLQSTQVTCMRAAVMGCAHSTLCFHALHGVGGCMDAHFWPSPSSMLQPMLHLTLPVLSKFVSTHKHIQVSPGCRSRQH